LTTSCRGAGSGDRAGPPDVCYGHPGLRGTRWKRCSAIRGCATFPTPSSPARSPEPPSTYEPPRTWVPSRKSITRFECLTYFKLFKYSITSRSSGGEIVAARPSGMLLCLSCTFSSIVSRGIVRFSLPSKMTRSSSLSLTSSPVKTLSFVGDDERGEIFRVDLGVRFENRLQELERWKLLAHQGQLGAEIGPLGTDAVAIDADPFEDDLAVLGVAPLHRHDRLHRLVPLFGTVRLLGEKDGKVRLHLGRLLVEAEDALDKRRRRRAFGSEITLGMPRAPDVDIRPERRVGGVGDEFVAGLDRGGRENGLHGGWSRKEAQAPGRLGADARMGIGRLGDEDRLGLGELVAGVGHHAGSRGSCVGRRGCEHLLHKRLVERMKTLLQPEHFRRQAVLHVLRQGAVLDR
jgi:hypothetical protein